MHSGEQSGHPKSPGFHYCQVEEPKTGFTLWCQDAAQRMCIYFSKLCELTHQTVPAWEEKVKHSDLISTKNLIHHAGKLVKSMVIKYMPANIFKS